MKAQAWSFDFMASVTVFFFVLAALFFTWQYISFQSQDQMTFNEMESSALTIAETMIRTRGFPENWDATNVEVLGLASEENVLNETKLKSFIQMDYDISRSILGIPTFHYNFSLQHLNGTVINSGGLELSSGQGPSSTSTAVLPVYRYVLFDSRVARLSFVMWR